MALSMQQAEALIGTLLGDGHLNRDGRYVRLKIDHSWEQAAYVWWKFEIFRNLTLREPQKRVVYERREGRNPVSIHCRFATHTTSDLEEYHQLFYANGRKIVPQDIHRLLRSPLSLAVWYMDDGARRTDCQALRLHTNSFTLEEQHLLRETLASNFNIEVTIHRVRAPEHVLYVPSREAIRFCDIVRPYILPAMSYKLL
jgi:hypothetical protein